MHLRSQGKNTTSQLQGAALPDKYKNSSSKLSKNSNSVIAIVAQDQPGPSVERGPVRLPNEILQYSSTSDL